MFGSEKDCSRYNYKIEIYNENKKTRQVFCGEPYPLEMEEEEKETAGLLVSYDNLKKLCFNTDDDGSLSFKIKLTIELDN